MYINSQGRLIIDSIDYFLLSYILSYYCTDFVKKKYFPTLVERQKLAKLREDWIRQSKLLSKFDRQKIKTINTRPIKPPVVRGGGTQLNPFWLELLESSWLELESGVDVRKIGQVFLVIDNLFLDSFKIMNPITLVLPNDHDLSMFPDQAKIEDELYYKPRSRDIRNLPIAFAIYTRKIILALAGLLATYPENKTAQFILNYIFFVLTRFNFVIVYDPTARRNAIIMCWFSGSALGITGAWVGVGGVALVHLAVTIFLGRTFTQQLFELLGSISSVDNSDNLKLKEKIDRLLGRSDDIEYWKEKIEQLLRPNSKSLANGLNLNLRNNYGNINLRWIDLISFTRLPFNQVCSIVWLLIMLEELKQLQKRCEEFYLILEEQGLTNYLNDPLLQFIRVSKLYDVFYPKKAVSTPKKNFLSSKKKFVASKILNVRTKVSNIRTKITNVRMRIKITKLRIDKEKAADFISSVLGYGSLAMGVLTALFRDMYYELNIEKPTPNYKTEIRFERSLEEMQNWNSPKFISNSKSKTPKILLPENFLGPSCIIQGKSMNPKMPVELETEFIEYIEFDWSWKNEEISSPEEIPAPPSGTPVAIEPIITDPITIEIEIESEPDSDIGPIKINK